MPELYAIAGNSTTAKLLLASQVPYLQLRFKEAEPPPNAETIRQWVVEYPRTKLIVNDDLSLAIASKVWGVHLGQEDLQCYPAEALSNLPLQLGISTHTAAEIENALLLGANHIGFGPIFPTSTKAVKQSPQGIRELVQVVESTPIPVVAIGGIQPHHLAEVAQTGVAMVAMIGALAQCTQTRQVQQLMRLLT